MAASSSELDSLEERYWHDFNDFQLQLRAHIDERDVLVNKVCLRIVTRHNTSCFTMYCEMAPGFDFSVGSEA